MRHFATAIEGLGPVLAEELSDNSDVTRIGSLGSDGRNDVVAFQVPGKPFETRIAEDVFVEVAAVSMWGSAKELARRLVDARALDRALSVYASWRRPLATRMRFRVVTRVHTERQFQRTELRDAVTYTLAAAKPRWVVDDPAEIELWTLEVAAGVMVSGIRLTTSELRQRGGRVEEREGALRPTVAAAMVRLAGQADGGVLLDPCCGSGTILREAASAGWDVAGSDIDAEALAIARANAPTAGLLRADARALPVATGRADAVVANLPFGGKFTVPGNPARWLAATLEEMARTVRRGRIIVLIPTSSGWSAARAQVGVTVERRLELRLLGFVTTLWQLRTDGGKTTSSG